MSPDDVYVHCGTESCELADTCARFTTDPYKLEFHTKYFKPYETHHGFGITSLKCSWYLKKPKPKGDLRDRIIRLAKATRRPFSWLFK